MAQRTQIRRNIDTEVQQFIGEPGELIYNLTTKRLHTQDGSTPGGHPLALLSEIGTVGGGESTSIMTFRKSGDGVTLSFVLPTGVASIDLTHVYINGVYQQKNGYTVSSTGTSTTIHFIDEAPPIGVNNIEIVAFTAVNIGQSTATTRAVLLSGTGRRMSYTLPVPVVSQSDTQVYINGIYQQKNTYDVTGYDLVFFEAPMAGTNNIEVIIIGSALNNSGMSSARPTGVSVGFQFYDTTLRKPIYWDGTVWRDAMSTAV